MKVSKSVLLVMVLAFALLGGIIFFPVSTSSKLDASDFLRIHIRANSNSVQDQNIKYQIKDELVKVLAPLLSEAETKERAMIIVNENLPLITQTANSVLSENGFGYTSEANLHSEFFPTRTYDVLTLESGRYDALILKLGLGEGDN